MDGIISGTHISADLLLAQSPQLDHLMDDGGSLSTSPIPRTWLGRAGDMSEHQFGVCETPRHMGRAGFFCGQPTGSLDIVSRNFALRNGMQATSQWSNYSMCSIETGCPTCPRRSWYGLEARSHPAGTLFLQTGVLEELQPVVSRLAGDRLD